MHITFGKLFVLVNYEDSLSHFSSALVMKGSAKIIIFSHFCGTYPVTLISHSNLQPKKTVKVATHGYWTKKKRKVDAQVQLAEILLFWFFFFFFKWLKLKVSYYNNGVILTSASSILLALTTLNLITFLPKLKLEFVK